ncbi:MAG: sulfite exporter TauE/SafE family protein [Thiohalomonadales bacterium]
MEWTYNNLLFATLTICLGSVLQAATGLGAGLIVVPLLAFISYELIPGPMIFASLSLTAIMTVRGWRHISFAHFSILLPGLLVGIVFAASIIKLLPLNKLGVVYGILIIVAVIFSLFASSVNVTGRWYAAIGALSGFMGTTAAVGAPILALLYQTKRGATLRATLAFLYFVSSIVILLSLHFAGKFSLIEVFWGIYLIPGFIIGYLIAPIFTRWIDRGYARPAVLILSAISAMLLIIKSL